MNYASPNDPTGGLNLAKSEFRQLTFIRSGGSPVDAPSPVASVISTQDRKTAVAPELISSYINLRYPRS